MSMNTASSKFLICRKAHKTVPINYSFVVLNCPGIGNLMKKLVRSKPKSKLIGFARRLNPWTLCISMSQKPFMGVCVFPAFRLVHMVSVF